MRSSSRFVMLVGCMCWLPTACVPADEALPLGSAEFTITGRGSPRTLAANVVVDQWSIHVDRFLLSFRTMTIVNLAMDGQCAYRGRGAATNVVFDGAVGSVVQAFNGIMPGDCPDVGMRLAPPDDHTVPGEGASVEDILTLLGGQPAHALFEATATHAPGLGFTEPETIKLSLRFDSLRTASSFGGCRDAVRGARIRPEARDAIFVAVAAEAFFRDAISTSAHLRFEPFASADREGNNDGLVTMDELDQLPLNSAGGPFYQLPNGSHAGSFGDYVRAQFMFSVKYGEGGLCNGIEAGTELP
ncbi:MAG: hypothetical protein QOI41_951 [Myxococcales bacterium]|nr:hypothetical protein [Myxococcales bacterium]